MSSKHVMALRLSNGAVVRNVSGYGSVFAPGFSGRVTTTVTT